MIFEVRAVIPAGEYQDHNEGTNDERKKVTEYRQ